MFERCAPLKTQRIVAKHVKDLFGFIPEIGNLIGFIVPLSCTYFHPENRNLIAPECDTFESENVTLIFDAIFPRFARACTQTRLNTCELLTAKWHKAV